MALTIPNPTYATSGPAKSGQVLAPNELTGLEQAFIGRTTITLDGTLTTGTINFIDGTQTIFANGDAAGTTTAPKSVTVDLVAASTPADLGTIRIAAGTPTTTGFPFFLSAAGTAAHTVTVQFQAYKN